MKTMIKKSIWIIIVLFLFAFYCSNSLFFLKPNAEESVVPNIEKTSVMDDLNAMTVNGKAFDIKDYAFDEIRDVQVISFVESCYSYYSDKQENYGLYVYLWNPKGLSFQDDSTRNTIQFSYGEYYDVPVKYSFKILDKSDDSGYEGLFYKLKIILSDEQKSYILGSLNSVARTYHVSGIELLEVGKAVAVEYPISATFTYSGFSKGFGSDDSAESTLSCTRDCLETLGLDVYHTYYRSSGTNGETNYTHDTLMTAYFSIPNNVLEKYDRLSGVSCSWIKVLTDWIYVTGRYYIYTEYLKWISHDSSVCNHENWVCDNGTKYDITDNILFPYGFCATDVAGNNIVKCNYSGEDAAETIERLNYVFWTGSSATNSADNYVLDNGSLYDWMLAYQEKYGQEDDEYLKVDGSDYTPYNANLFESSRAKTHKVVVSADERKSLTSEKITATWWQKLWGDTTLQYRNTFDNIEAIKMITSEDMNRSASELSEYLYINTDDIGDFKVFYESEKRKGRTVFLMRYDVGEYQSVETRQGKPDNSGFTVGFDDGDTNGYVCREHVYLNFDIIHCEFEKNGETVIIPVVSSPVDVITSGDPPANTTDDTFLLSNIKNLLDDFFNGIVEIFTLIVYAFIFGFVIWAISKLIGWLISIIKNLFNGGKK